MNEVVDRARTTKDDKRRRRVYLYLITIVLDINNIYSYEYKYLLCQYSIQYWQLVLGVRTIEWMDLIC